MDAFDRLGLDADATADQVRARYKELALQQHPDRGGDAAEFAALTEAYEAALRKSSEPKPCPQCRGHGKVKFTRGFTSVDLTCPTCGGDGVRR